MRERRRGARLAGRGRFTFSPWPWPWPWTGRAVEVGPVANGQNHANITTAKPETAKVAGGGRTNAFPVSQLQMPLPLWRCSCKSTTTMMDRCPRPWTWSWCRLECTSDYGWLKFTTHRRNQWLLFQHLGWISTMLRPEAPSPVIRLPRNRGR